MTGNGKYVLTQDIDVNGWLSNADYSPLIKTLESESVIDGNGHFVKNGKLPGGWNKSWIETVKGTVRNTPHRVTPDLNNKIAELSEDLSPSERQEVEQFIAYLKSKR